uniref:Uncharacterized protein n=1 Tax=Cacopsylla melanoneura TaxID=428564 RepID=A0A8D8QZX4_9HEMI
MSKQKLPKVLKCQKDQKVQLQFGQNHQKSKILQRKSAENQDQKLTLSLFHRYCFNNNLSKFIPRQPSSTNKQSLTIKGTLTLITDWQKHDSLVTALCLLSIKG